MLNPEPQAQHRWLQQLLGDWTCESTCDAGSGEPPMTTTGTEHVRQLGELWVPGEGTGSMPGGGDARTLITLGFDTEKEAFIGTWIGSMATHMWVYRGTLDATEKVLPLETVGPSFTGDGSTARYRDTITLIGPSERMLTSATHQSDGSWKDFMKATYRRKTS